MRVGEWMRERYEVKQHLKKSSTHMDKLKETDPIHKDIPQTQVMCANISISVMGPTEKIRPGFFAFEEQKPYTKTRGRNSPKQSNLSIRGR